VLVTPNSITRHDPRFPTINGNAGHQDAAHSKQEGCLFILNQVFVEVDALLAVVSRWRRKTRMNTGDKARYGYGNSLDLDGLHVSENTVFTYSIAQDRAQRQCVR
jgi:hypothetical protein